jgi:hypothetical protein
VSLRNWIHRQVMWLTSHSTAQRRQVHFMLVTSKGLCAEYCLVHTVSLHLLRRNVSMAQSRTFVPRAAPRFPSCITSLDVRCCKSARQSRKHQSAELN